MDKSSLPTPLRRPVASQRQFRAWLKEIEADVLTPPWYIVPRFFYLRKGELPAPDGDETCYACAITYSQYHKVEVRVCPDHPNWTDERDLQTCLRHEVFHSFFGALNDVLASTLPKELQDNGGFNALWNNAEDEATNRLASMPIFSRKVLP
jgi:hypothetical protein